MQVRRLLALALALVACVASLQAWCAQRTFVRSDGADANPCSIAAPCRSFTQAATHTDPNGEIIVLDSGGYGQVTITQSLSIIAPPGVFAGISVFDGAGILINAPSIAVTLRGLTINGQGPNGGAGISIANAGNVLIDDVSVSSMPGAGITIVSPRTVTITNSRIRMNGTDGISMLSTGPALDVVIERSLIDSNATNGILAFGGTAAAMTIRECVVTRNGQTGFEMFADAGQDLKVLIERSSVSDNGVLGLHLNGQSGTASLAISDNAIHHNGVTGVLKEGAIPLLTRDNNTFIHNAFNISPGGGPTTPFGGL